jgi:hypothetical protein
MGGWWKKIMRDTTATFSEGTTIALREKIENVS